MGTRERIPDDEITPPSVYFNRRALMQGGLLAASVAATGLVYRKLNVRKASTAETERIKDLKRGTPGGSARFTTTSRASSSPTLKAVIV